MLGLQLIHSSANPGSIRNNWGFVSRYSSLCHYLFQVGKPVTSLYGHMVKFSTGNHLKKIPVFYAIIFPDWQYSQLLNTNSSLNVWPFLQEKDKHGGTSKPFMFLYSFLQALFDIADWATQSRSIDQRISNPLWTQMTNIIMHDMMEN